MDKGDVTHDAQHYTDITEISQLAFNQGMTIRFDGRNLVLPDGTEFDLWTVSGKHAARDYLQQEETEDQEGEQEETSLEEYVPFAYRDL